MQHFMRPVLTSILLVIVLSSSHSVHAQINDISQKQTIMVYETIPCLAAEEIDFGKEVIQGLDYNAQRIFRKFCRIPGINFAKCKDAWVLLVRYRLSYEQMLTFETWSDLKGVTPDLALESLGKISALTTREDSESFRQYCKIPKNTAALSLKVIPLLVNRTDTLQRAIHSFFKLKDITLPHALSGLQELSFLVNHQCRAAQSFAELADMKTETMLDALPLIRQLRQDDAWNASILFGMQETSRDRAWNLLVSFLATPSTIQENVYYSLPSPDRQILLRAFHRGGDELIWKINNFHAITDRFGIEISQRELHAASTKQLLQQFEKLPPVVKTRYEKSLLTYAARNSADQLIALLGTATTESRRVTAQMLTSPNIYALMAQGSELYDSSFRDILAPELKERIRKKYQGNLLRFLKETDSNNLFTSDFVVSLAQKGKLTDFFPQDPEEQTKILDLTSASALKDEHSIILFSATFMHLLEVLKPEARSHLIATMAKESESDKQVYARLVRIILQYYLDEYPELLGTRDRDLIHSLVSKHGVVRLNDFMITPFSEWKKDGLLSSISVFHPDDDGNRSFASNGSLLLQSGYTVRVANPHDLHDQFSPGQPAEISALVDGIGKNPGPGLARLFHSMQHHGYPVIFEKTVNGTRIRHLVSIYRDEKDQEKLLELFIRGDYEMFAQRGHSYWRSEQLIEPLKELLKQKKINESNLLAKQRFISLGSCGGMKIYSELNDLFLGRVDILATIGTGMSFVNDPYNKRFFEIIAANRSDITWKDIAEQIADIFGKGYGKDYLQPGSLPSILHKYLNKQHNHPSTPAPQGRQ